MIVVTINHQAEGSTRIELSTGAVSRWCTMGEIAILADMTYAEAIVTDTNRRRSQQALAAWLEAQGAATYALIRTAVQAWVASL